MLQKNYTCKGGRKSYILEIQTGNKAKDTEKTAGRRVQKSDAGRTQQTSATGQAGS